MIAERIQQPGEENFSPASTKYYQFSTILEHVIDCLHTIVSDKTNPYHPPLGWLTRKSPKPPDDELFLDLMDECTKTYPSSPPSSSSSATSSARDSYQLSYSVRMRLERCPQHQRHEIVSRTQDGCSPLFMVCRNGLTRFIKYLLDVCQANIEQRGRFEAFEDHHVHSVTPIWVAAVSGRLEVVRLLIDRGANVNSISDTGSTPLRSVCFLCKDDDGASEYDNNDHADVFSFGGVADDEDEDRRDVYMKIVHLLVEHGADISQANYNGGTCLINSLHNHRLTKYIISHGADVNAIDNQSKTALHYAIQQDRLEVAKLLLASGANPFLTTNTCDDALQLCCIGGHVEIFNYLVENYTYSSRQLSDAYKLLGSSILEIHYDLAQVRRYWTKSLEVLDCPTPSVVDEEQTKQTMTSTSTSTTTNSSSSNFGTKTSQKVIEKQTFSDNDNGQVANCDIRRSIVYGDTREFTSPEELLVMSVDDFRIQSLLISERVLGSDHRETIQRLLYRGTFYINSLMPNRCLDLWIYALKLRLDSDSIFHFESIFAAQAITKLFLDLFSQHQHKQVKFNDVYDVLSLLVDRLPECQQLLTWRPRSCLHEDIFDLLLSMIVNLLLVLRCVQRRKREEFDMTTKVTKQLVQLNPLTSNGSSLLHICVAPSMFEGDTHRSLQIASDALATSRTRESMPNSDDNNGAKISPMVQLIDDLIDAGLDIDLTNNEGLSALQVLCLATNMRAGDKGKIIGLLVENGAHVDRRALTLEQDEQIRHALHEANVKLVELVTLRCLAARKVSEMKATRIKLDEVKNTNLTRILRELIAIH